MGAVAARLADLAVITSDNPRSEDPLAIVEEILRGGRGGGRGEVESSRPTGGRRSGSRSSGRRPATRS